MPNRSFDGKSIDIQITSYVEGTPWAVMKDAIIPIR